MISFVDVTKTFGKLRVLDHVSLDFKQGKTFALVGPNGSGKTTLIKAFLGLVVPQQGAITFYGSSVANNWQYRKHIGYMPQIGHYPDNMTIGQLIEMMKNIRDTPENIDEELFESLKLYKLLNKRLHTLSGGTRQKVSAVLAFMFNPKVLVLDEPTAGLDPVSVELLKEKIMTEKAKGKLLIITSHILSDMDELATDVVYMMDGKIQYNNSIEILKDETNESRLGKAIATLIKQKELISTIMN
ncbi:MAG TPA: ABC transporter ATP-binding protein [Cyclobacteriaceae bacterium]